MNSKKRNQLIGFIALVLLALVLFPYVITDKSNRTKSTISLLPESNINQNSEMDLVDSLESINAQSETDSNSADSQSNSSTDLTNSTSSANSTTDTPASSVELYSDKKSDKNYVIQLVALKNRQKIEELVVLLILNNYNVYTDPVKPKEGQVIRLFVGNYPTKEQAEIVIIDLENLTKLKGFVTTK